MVCGDHQVKSEKHKTLLEKLELYRQEAIEDGYYELVI